MTISDDELLDVLRQALTTAIDAETRAHLDVRRYRAAIDALGGAAEVGECHECGVTGDLLGGICVDGCRVATTSAPERKPPVGQAGRPKSPGELAPARPPGRSKYDYAEVARVANAAAPGRRTADVAEAFDVKPGMASQLIQEARRRGHVIDAPASGPGSSTHAAPRSACDRGGGTYSPAGLASHRRSCKDNGAKPADVPSGLGPIERTPFDPQRVRDAQAGPSKPIMQPNGQPHPPTRAEAQARHPSSNEPRFGVERALAVLDGGKGNGVAP